MIKYSRLEKILRERNIKKSAMGRDLGISSRTIAKIGRGERLSARILDKLARYLGCSPEELYEVVADNPLLQRLREEKQIGLPGGLYHELQVRLTYNSNHMEGSRLTEEQTRLIFETRTLAGDGLLLDDILETWHHFQAIDYCIEIAEAPLTEELIKRLHYILKHDTQDARLDWFAVGEYKKRENFVGGRATAPPGQVKKQMAQLLAAYHAKPEISLQDIVSFHAAFEKIHPFQDGNGRVGRLIAFKECLKHSIVPFVIADEKKGFYYRGLAQWETEQGYLLDTCRDGQDTVRALLQALGAEELAGK